MSDQQNQCHGGAHGQDHPQVVAVLVPIPAQGHLNQLLQLSHLLLSHNIPVHYVSTATHLRQAKHRLHGGHPQSTTAKIHFHSFEIPHFTSPPPDPNSTTKFPSHLQPVFNASIHLRAPVADLVRTLSGKSKRVIVIHDSVIGYVVQDVWSIPNVESFNFYSISALAIFQYIWENLGRPKIFENAKEEEIVEDVPSLDGCLSPEFKEFLEFQDRFQNSGSGHIYNTSKVIEGTTMELLERTLAGHKHWALGPFHPVQITPEKPNSAHRNICLEWLDKQRANSVIYVSFGTTTTFCDKQITELAMGLKSSGQKFLWVLREADKGDIFSEKDGRRPGLPIGFENSVRDLGLVVRDWAPQLEILSHPAIGGFISHCGWNSCLESITMGVPIGAWPMHSDQPRNSVLVTKLLKIGIAVRDWARRDEVVTAVEVGKAVKRLMASEEGNVMRKRAAELGAAVRRSVAEGGGFRGEWHSFIAHINR